MKNRHKKQLLAEIGLILILFYYLFFFSFLNNNESPGSSYLDDLLKKCVKFDTFKFKMFEINHLTTPT